MGRKINSGSRVARRVGTKSAIRLNCQRKTRGAANRAAKTLTGKDRVQARNKRTRDLALFLVDDALVVHTNEDRRLEEMRVEDPPMAQWERGLY